MLKVEHPGGASPIVGAPYRVTKWTVSATIECACSARCDVVIIRGNAGQVDGSCPVCGATFSLGGIRYGPDQPHPALAIAYTPLLLVGEA